MTMIIDSPKRREHLAAIAARMPAHVERLSWSAEQISEERQRALCTPKRIHPGMRAGSDRVDPATFTEADL